MTCLRSRVPRKAASPASTPRPGRRLAAGRGHVLRPLRFLLSSLQKSLKSPPYAHTSAEHGSDRSKFKGRCGRGSSDGIRGQATPANPHFLGRHPRGSAYDAGCFDRTLAARPTVSRAVAVCPRDYVLVVRDAPGRRERPVRLVG